MKEEKLYELHMAPMQGYTDLVFRNAFAKCFGGVDVYYTPVVRLENNQTFRKKDLRELEKEQNRVDSLIPQILPGSLEECRILLETVAGKGYQRIDINFGCPFPLLVGRKKGAGMLPHPERVEAILSIISECPEIRFSMKMRLGWEQPDEWKQLIDMINDAPLEHVTLHPRIGKQQYKGEVHIEAFGEFYQQCKHPLLYNGDIHTLQDIRQILTCFPDLRGVMIGRGLVADPFLACDFKGKGDITEEEKRQRFREFHRILLDAYSSYLQGEVQILTKMKTLWEYFLPETEHKLLKKIKKANRLSDYRSAVDMIFKDA